MAAIPIYVACNVDHVYSVWFMLLSVFIIREKVSLSLLLRRKFSKYALNRRSAFADVYMAGIYWVYFVFMKHYIKCTHNYYYYFLPICMQWEETYMLAYRKSRYFCSYTKRTLLVSQICWFCNTVKSTSVLCMILCCLFWKICFSGYHLVGLTSCVTSAH